MQATKECGFTLKRVRDMIRTYSQYNDNIVNSHRQLVDLNLH